MGLLRVKILLGGCKKGVTYTTTGERMGYRNLERIHVHVFPCISGRKIQKIKMGMHGWVQLDACNWWGKGGDGRGDMRL